jgi:hypothetical protein
VLPSQRPAARAFVIERLRRILETGAGPLGLTREALADLPASIAPASPRIR